MMNFKKTIELTNLYNIYQSLLTEKQKQYFSLHFEEDLSLQEIADALSVSKSAVHDSIQKVIKQIEHWEEKLKLGAKQNIYQSIILKYKNSDNLEIQGIINKIKEML